MKVRVIKIYKDTQLKKLMGKIGEEFEVTDERAEILLNAKVVEVVEESTETTPEETIETDTEETVEENPETVIEEPTEIKKPTKRRGKKAEA